MLERQGTDRHGNKITQVEHGFLPSVADFLRVSAIATLAFGFYFFYKKRQLEKISNEVKVLTPTDIQLEIKHPFSQKLNAFYQRLKDQFE